MKLVDLTFASPAENLAFDESLLDLCEDHGEPEILRFWEPTSYFVVVGYANKVNLEANIALCNEKQIPVLRRCSGGGTVLQGPGCLNYSLILSTEKTTALQTITEANRFIMREIARRWRKFLENVKVEGHTDLAIDGFKFSGNAQRRRKKALLFHGSFLLDFDISLIEQCLRMPTQQPGYRQNRSHQSFLTNLNCSTAALKKVLRLVWNAEEKFSNVPETDGKLLEKYSDPEWNLKF